jgi:hypothetical protein
MLASTCSISFAVSFFFAERFGGPLRRYRGGEEVRKSPWRLGFEEAGDVVVQQQPATEAVSSTMSPSRSGRSLKEASKLRV